MAADTIEEARAAKAAAEARLADLEAAEAQRVKEAAEQRLAERKEVARKFLADLPGLEAHAKGETITPQQKGEALAAGTLGALVANFLARRDVLQRLRDYALGCYRLLDQDPIVGLPEVRHVDPAEEFRRWNEAAMSYLQDRDAQALAEEALSPYQAG
ncbi:hypothetical protein [Streptomyces sp. Cmuel-A718b]|uniref:hypothetical protein n=1 Tax=Streptomyces sp. Cmuel-A718b TaxID=697328 RepID=UPI00081D7ED0|nr:hypothetical protein [Streptomyces sp. Cmuel-A718b]SCF58255.1 hypothetical protein GA0115280_102532 [Streptomyces sp. Cmuel-A718b]